MQIVLPSDTVHWFAAEDAPIQADLAYYLGLAIFTVTVVAYTTYGGFLAAVWTDVFQSIVMAVGVVILFPMAMIASGGLAQATYTGMSQAGDGFAFGPGAGRAFHPITVALSFFVMWAITGMGQPSTMVRLMAFRDSKTLRYSILYLTIYNAMIYVPLIFIFIAARSILPGLKETDQVMPLLVIKLANPYVAGLILAAPYGAVMSTVSGWLLIIASGLVRDVYQRFLRQTATEREIARASYLATVAIGLLVAVVALRPPKYLQLIVVFASAGMAAAFLVPALMGCFWRRASAAGAIAAMAIGAGVTLALYVVGTILAIQGHDQGIGPKASPSSPFAAYYLFGFDPCVWGLLASIVAGIVVSLLSRPPDPARVALLFDAQPTDAPAPATLELHPEMRKAVE
jgi:SSS family solute:Na+ symporter/sodium/pantothenate symporter